MSESSYPPPVDKLLTYGDCSQLPRWPNYLELGIEPEHIPDLIRMATDEDLRWVDSDLLKVPTCRKLLPAIRYSAVTL